MSTTPGIVSYLIRDSLLRWSGRISMPLSRLAIALSLATTAILVMASFALATAELQNRIAAFGLDTLIVRSPMDHVADPAPDFSSLKTYGQVFSIKLTYARIRLDTGGIATLGIADDHTLQDLATLGVRADSLPLLLTSDLPEGTPVHAGIGPWWVDAQTAALPASLQTLNQGNLLIASAADFPAQISTPGVAVTLLNRAATAPPLTNLVTALRTVLAANTSAERDRSEVQSPLALLREMHRWQRTSARYTALIALVLTITVALVFAAGAILEYETTVYTTALLRSLGVRRRILWLQRTLEALLLANLGGGAACLAAGLIARFTLPQLAAFSDMPAAILPVFVALNAGACLAALPVANALRRPVGLILP